MEGLQQIFPGIASFTGDHKRQQLPECPADFRACGNPDAEEIPAGYSKLPELHIAASEIVSDETFEQMQAHPLWDHDVIQKHIQDMRSVAGGEYCLLIAPENGTDGLLVRSEGSSCARYSAYIPGGRLMTLVTPELERIMEGRKIYQYTGDGQPLPVTEGSDALLTAVAAPILAEGDLLGLVLFITSDGAAVTGDTEYKLAQTIAAFLGRHMES